MSIYLASEIKHSEPFLLRMGTLLVYMFFPNRYPVTVLANVPGREEDDTVSPGRLRDNCSSMYCRYVSTREWSLLEVSVHYSEGSITRQCPSQESLHYWSVHYKEVSITRECLIVPRIGNSRD